MDLALWEKARRYRRIATFASDDEAASSTKRPARFGEEKIKADTRESGARDASAVK